MFVQQDTVEFFFMIIVRSIWITLLFSILGSCKRSSSNLNRVIGSHFLETCKDQEISIEECERQKQACLQQEKFHGGVLGVCWDEKKEICLPDCQINSKSQDKLVDFRDIINSNRMIQNDHDEPSINSGKELKWPPKIEGLRAAFNNRIGPAGIDWSNPKDVGVKPSGQKPPKNTNRLVSAKEETTSKPLNLEQRVNNLEERAFNMEKKIIHLENIPYVDPQG